MSRGGSWLPPRRLAAVVIVATILWGGYLAWLIRTDPRIVYLAPENGAQWLIANERVHIGVRYAGFFMTHFRTSVPAGPARDAVLTLRALRLAEVFLDGRSVYQTPRDLGVWKQSWRVPLHIEASDRPHELLVTVVNESGFPALLAFAPGLGIATGPAWEARNARQTAFLPALVAGPRIAEFSRRFPRTDEALRGIAPMLLVVLVGVAALTVVWGRAGPTRLRVSPAAFRWLVMAAWGALAANNIWKLPLHVGFDVGPHVEYIRYLAQHWRIPLATEGEQMFQPPLYHLLSALLVWVPARSLLDEETVLRLLRIIPLACGVAQVELAYRAARLAFPTRDDLQRLGTLLGGLLPINVYMSQYVGNEPLAGVLAAAVILMLLRAVVRPADALAPRFHWLIGALLGLAALTKLTGLLLVLPTLLVLAYAHAHSGRPPATFLRSGMRVLAMLALLTGWYYLRNSILLGTPVMGVWDRSQGLAWWQEPGYRVAAHFTSFGEALWFPVFGGVVGLWDAEYSSLWLDGWLSAILSYEHRPPWNYSLMLAAPWVALLPTCALVVGAASAIRRPDGARRALVLAVGLVAVYLAATVSRYLQVPIYSAAKATQLLGLTPCFAVLGAAGYEVLGRVGAVRPLLYGATACWALCAFFAYVVR